MIRKLGNVHRVKVASMGPTVLSHANRIAQNVYKQMEHVHVVLMGFMVKNVHKDALKIVTVKHVT